MEDDGVTVKNRMKMFEAEQSGGGDSPFRGGAKPSPAVGAKPTPLSKPTIAAKLGGSVGKETGPKPASKWGGGGGVTSGASVAANKFLKQDHNQNVVSNNGSASNPPSTVNSAKNMFEKRLSNAKDEGILPNGKPNGVVTPASASAKTNGNETVKTLPPKPAIVTKPTAPPKFGAKPTLSQKPSPLTSSGSDKATSEDKPVASSAMGTKSGQALANFLQKQAASNTTDSTSSTSSSPPPSSTSSTVSSDTSGPHDFRSKLRPSSKTSTPISDASSSKPTSPSPSSLSSSSPTSPTSPEEVKSPGPSSLLAQWKHKERESSDDKPPLLKQVSKTSVTSDADQKPRSPLSEADINVTLRNRNSSQKRQKSCNSGVLERKSDGKKFRKLKFENIPKASSPPAKPPVPTDIDLKAITDQYHKAIINLKEEARASTDGLDEVDDDDMYSDATSVQLPRKSTFRKASQRISIIPDMTEEEEGAVEELIYDDGMTPAQEDDVYDDGQTEKPIEATEEDVYEDEDTIIQQMEELQKKESEQERRKRLKKEEKERKEREKKEEAKRKKEEKERLNREKEEKRQRERFQLTGEEVDVGEGVISQNAKGRGDNLTVQKGQKVSIVRLDKNPSNKWLVRNGTQMGYVDSSIIDIDPSIIRQLTIAEKEAMSSSKNNATQNQDGSDEQPNYDDVPLPTMDDVDEFEDDGDVYEAFD